MQSAQHAQQQQGVARLTVGVLQLTWIDSGVQSAGSSAQLGTPAHTYAAW